MSETREEVWSWRHEAVKDILLSMVTARDS